MSFENSNPSYSNPSSVGPAGFGNYPQPPRKSGVSWIVGLLLVGFGVVVLGGIVCIGGVWYVATNLDKWVVGLGREAIVAGINDSELPQAEKAEVITQVDRVVTAYKERKIDQTDLQRVLTELEDSPAMKALSLYGIEDAYFTDTSLSEREIEQGRRAFQRAVRAVFEGKISDDDFYAVLPDETEEPVRLASTKEAENNSDEALRESIAKLKLIADNARIPDESFELKVGAAVKSLVDRALEGK